MSALRRNVPDDIRGMNIPGWVVAAHIDRVTAEVTRRRRPRYGIGLTTVLALIFVSLAVFGRGIA